MGESFEECSAREVFEETGLCIERAVFKTAVNNLFPDGRHYVTIFTSALVSGEILEPQVCRVLNTVRPRRCIAH